MFFLFGSSLEVSERVYIVSARVVFALVVYMYICVVDVHSQTVNI